MHILTIVITAVLLAASLTTVSAQSPLGELARKEEERRKAIKGEGRVYTNKDLPNVPPPSSAPPSASTPAASADAAAPPPADAAADAAATADATPDEVPRGRAYWSGRVTTLRETLARNQTYAEALQSRINALTTDFVNRDDPLQRAAIAADRDRAMRELERLRKQLAADAQAIEDLETEARRAGVPAGWLR